MLSHTRLRANSGTILLTTLNNMDSTALFNAVFNNPEQVVRFFALGIVIDLSGKYVTTNTVFNLGPP